MKEKNLIFLAVAVLAVSFAAGFLFWRNTRTASTAKPSSAQRIVDACSNVQEPNTGIQCKEALTKALELYPGKVNSIGLSTIQFKEGLNGNPKDIQVWLVDINLKDFITTPVGNMKRIVLAIDPTSSLKPFVNQFFSVAL